MVFRHPKVDNRNLQVVIRTAFLEIAHGLVKYPWSVTFLVGVLAGWMIELMTWLVAAGQNTISQATSIWLVAVAIGPSHLPHSIAGSIKVLMGVFVHDGITVRQFFDFLLWRTLGNVVGGTIFVSMLKYGHGVRPGTTKDDIEMAMDGEEKEQCRFLALCLRYGERRWGSCGKMAAQWMISNWNIVWGDLW